MPHALTRLLDGYRSYVVPDDYAGYNPLGAQAGGERLGFWAHARRKLVEAQKVQPKGNPGRADIGLNLINKLYGIERDLKACGDLNVRSVVTRTKPADTGSVEKLDRKDAATVHRSECPGQSRQ